MRKLDLPVVGADCLTRRNALGSLAAAALTACSSTPAPNPTPRADAGNGGSDSGDDAGTGDDTGTEPTCAKTPAGTPVGSLASFPAGTWQQVGQAIIGHDANGLFAFTAICTHQGCLVGPPNSKGATTCPCHGSQFDGNGDVTQGPAGSPLVHFAVAVCGGEVYVDPRTEVPAATRTPPA